MDNRTETVRRLAAECATACLGRTNTASVPIIARAIQSGIDADRAAREASDRADLMAGDIEPHNDIERTVRVVRFGYDWTIDVNGRVCGLVAGDQGWESTHIVISHDDMLTALSARAPASDAALLASAKAALTRQEATKSLPPEEWARGLAEDFAKAGDKLEMEAFAHAPASEDVVSHETPIGDTQTGLPVTGDGQGGWCSDMEQAPRDGTPVLLGRDNGCAWEMIVAWWSRHDPDYPWQAIDNAYPESRFDAWRHLPTPPSPAKREEG